MSALQKGLSERDREAWALWNQVRPYVSFYSNTTGPRLKAVANVAVVVDDLDPSDETMNLLARHNIPFDPLRPEDLKGKNSSRRQRGGRVRKA